MIKKVERYNHYLRHPGGLFKFSIELFFLSIFLCFILSACNPESTVSENGQSINKETIIEENNSSELASDASGYALAGPEILSNGGQDASAVLAQVLIPISSSVN